MRARSSGVRLVPAGALVLLLPVAAAAQVQVHAGPVVAYSMLERKDTSLTHGPLEDEVTLGRSWLLGGILDVRPTAHNTLSIEFLYGPYPDDVDRYCVWRFSATGQVCQPGVYMQTEHVILFGGQYARSFGNGRWRPCVAGGFGLKHYTFRDEYRGPSTTSATFSFGGGVEAATRARIELKALFVRHNPLLYQLEQRNQFELQARLVVLVF